MRAITLALEALRQVDRYGVTKRAEQYRGFERIEAPKTSTVLERHVAAEVIQNAAGFENYIDDILSNPATRERVYREALFKVHPDHGGNAEDFRRVQAAKELLDRASGGK